MATKEFLNKQTKIPSTSREWSSIEYNLKLCIGSTTPVVKQIWSISSPHLINSFEKISQGMLVLDSWVDTSKLNEDNRIEEICGKGFNIPSAGLVFSVGSLKADSSLSFNRTYEFMLVKVAVGKSYTISLDSIENTKISAPKGYDSVYLYNHSPNSYNHNYLLTESSQILPSFLVQFELDPNLEEGVHVQLCDICQESKASLFCSADNAVLCVDCDEEHHTRGNKLMQRHKRVSIAEKPKRFGNCSFHLDSHVEFYCSTCLIPICIHCKMVGSHSTPETSNHVFERINEAYARALSEASEPDPLLEQKKSQLKSFLTQLDDRINEIKHNAEQIESKIYKALQEVLLQLQQETQGKISNLLACEMEIKRQLEEISWIECFLKYEQEILSPAHFMVAWGRHCDLKSELFTSEDVIELAQVLPDIKLEGHLHVTTDIAIRNRPGQSEVQSLASSTPKTSSSKFRSQLFGRHQMGSLDKAPNTVLRQMIPSKPSDALSMKFNSMLNLPSGKRSSKGSEDEF
jgi:CRISPR/Cas system CSM-associated protein Csm2 small subunit